jgi:hypothetical protein
MQPRNEGKIALDALVRSGGFRFSRLVIEGIDHSKVVEFFGPGILEQEICLLHGGVAGGDGYVDLLHDRVSVGMRERKETPVVRFADGEYAFYEGSLRCNGLYRQAESAEAIRAALPAHVKDLRYVAEKGMLAPLVFPGNSSRGKRKLPRFWKFSGDDSAARFLVFLSRNGVELTSTNYVPFYAVYAYLTSERFARAVDGRNVCILNSDIDREACERWFQRFSSRPELVEVQIPGSFVATRWASMEEEILGGVPGDADLCLVGAGVGALPVCTALSRRFSIPSLDAGHALNLMNDMENKSAGPRLYTIHECTTP